MAMFDISISGSAGWQLSARNMCSHYVKCGTVVQWYTMQTSAKVDLQWLQTLHRDTKHGYRRKTRTQTLDMDTDTKHGHRHKTLTQTQSMNTDARHGCQSLRSTREWVSWLPSLTTGKGANFWQEVTHTCRVNLNQSCG